MWSGVGISIAESVSGKPGVGSKLRSMTVDLQSIGIGHREHKRRLSGAEANRNPFGYGGGYGSTETGEFEGPGRPEPLQTRGECGVRPGGRRPCPGPGRTCGKPMLSQGSVTPDKAERKSTFKQEAAFCSWPSRWAAQYMASITKTSLTHRPSRDPAGDD